MSSELSQKQQENAETTTTTTEEEEEESRWTDAKIRWDDDDDDDNGGNDNHQHEEDEEDEEGGEMVDPFQDDPRETFLFSFRVPNTNTNTTTKSNNNNNNTNAIIINIELEGYKMNSNQIYSSTGLTLWPASKVLCNYLVEQHHENNTLIQAHNSATSSKRTTTTTTHNRRRRRRILEIGAGLGLCGILAYRLLCCNSSSMASGSNSNANNANNNNYYDICLTDGDTDALWQLRRNVERNIKLLLGDGGSSNDKDGDGSSSCRCNISCSQLLWGTETSIKFLRKQRQLQQPRGDDSVDVDNDDEYDEHGKFDLILASDIIYAPCIVQPLWETIQTLLKKHCGAKFIMSYKHGRQVPVTIESVIEAGNNAGFSVVEEKNHVIAEEQEQQRHVVVVGVDEHDEDNNNNNNNKSEEGDGRVSIYVFRWAD